MSTKEEIKIDIESQETTNESNNTSVCKMILFSLLSIILIFFLMIGIYTFVMMKNPMKLIP